MRLPPKKTREQLAQEFWEEIHKGNQDGSIATVGDVLDYLADQIEHPIPA